MRQTAIKVMIWTLYTWPKVLAAIAAVAVLIAITTGCASTSGEWERGEVVLTPIQHILHCQREPESAICPKN